MRLTLFLFLLPFIAYSQAFTPKEIAAFASQAKQVTIVRDNWGVPHIYGKSDADAVFGLMYAQCEENFYQVEENFIEMLGRLSEVHGEKEFYNDLQTKIIYDTSAAMEDYKKSPVWLRQLLDASAAGLNYYLYKHPEVKPRLIHRFQPWYALLRTDGSIGATQTGGLTGRDIREMYPTKNAGISYSENPLTGYQLDPPGSNGFAVAPSRTANGNAILYINPHTTFYFRPEVHIVSEEGLNAYGAVTWGTFFIYQGFNENCGWMHTSSYADVADLYEVVVSNDQGKPFYSFDKRILQPGIRKLEVSYKNSSGQLQAEAFTVYTTVHGPVVGSRDGKWLSLKENNRSMESLMQSWLRTKANGFEEYRKIMEMRVNNSNNTVFADNKGNIAYWHGNFMPRRNLQFDYSLPVKGNTSASLWTGLHQVEETVHVYNPKSGWIQNCNSTPFTVAGISSPKKENYPPYMAPDGENYRGITAARLLDQMDQMTIDKMIDSVGYNRYLSAFEVLQPALLNAFDSVSADPSSAGLETAIQLIRAWDRIPTKESIAAALAIEWGYRVLQKASPPPNPYRNTDATGQLNSALNNTSARQKMNLFEETMKDLQNRFGKWEVPWGEINRYQRPVDNQFDDSRESLAVGQAAATFGSLPSYATRRFSHTNRRYGLSGNSFIACVEFGKKVKARSVLTGGQSFDPRSIHYMDQAEMYIDGTFKDVLFYKADILKHAVRSYHPGE